MTSADAIRLWVDRYLSAWRSNDVDDIAALFAADAEYRTSPWRAPWCGVDEIVSGWLGRLDEPGTWTFEVEHVDAERVPALVQGVTRYADGPVYSNLWLVELDEAGRARAFTEWWMNQAGTS